ncbi:hypothetical protein F53441_10692 [Fusarium austroafricanum]|uniref:Telomeric single stranded DNA binding POT1/Cdc13 domain-containing protein n=1 Tax=Fusarium austroafricanum TaxID=2364996 RepID=A0A8H4NS08_9HYPO|nr:hypothetical protein F53441_10692 [Fusarium austroafricanum]
MAEPQLTTSLLDQGDSIPISQLNPDIPGQEKRLISGTITITWPFSILNKSIAFLLAERDFRLRRENGQVRIRFHGAAAKAIADASLGAGDEIRVSLQGAKWEKNETQTQVAGSTLAWQLEYTNHLTLGICRPEEEQETLLDINISAAGSETTTTNSQTDNTVPVDTLASVPEQPATPTPPSPEVTLPAKRHAASTLDPFEYSSPAFLKRARVSYGALFEGDLDVFDEDVSKKSKSKKRTRFSLPANAWRYTSRSPSPELNDAPEEVDEDAGGVSQPNGTAEDTLMGTPPRPTMVDQGSQTAYVDFTPMTSIQVLAESRPAFGFAQMTPTPFSRTRPFEEHGSDMSQSLRLQGDLTTPNGIPPRTHQDLLSHTPHNMDTDMAFSFTPQTVLFPQATNFYSAEDVHNTVPEAPSRAPGAENYPAEFLETEQSSSNAVEALTGLASHEPHSDVTYPNPFGPESAFHSTFTTTVPPPQSAWATKLSSGPRSAVASSDAENPVEILSSSPFREQGSRESSEEQQPSPSRENTDINTTANISPELTLEEPASEAEYYRDGGDEPGDDYDLRKYSRTHDDDDDVETSEEEPDVNNNDPDTQIMNPEEDDADVDEDVENQEEYYDDEVPDGYEEQGYEQRFNGEGEEYEGSEDDAEGEYYSDEEGYYDDEEEEEEEEEEDTNIRPSAPLASQGPVIIDLLSDSEDEEAPAPRTEPEPESKPEMDPKVDKGEEEKPLSRTEPTEETKTLPVPEAKADEDTAQEEIQYQTQPGAKEEPLAPPTNKETGHAAEPGFFHEERMDSLSGDPTLTSSTQDSITQNVEVADISTISRAIQDDDGSFHNKDNTEREQPSVTASAQHEFSKAEELPQHAPEAEEGPSPVGQGVGDIDMEHAPALREEPKEQETEDDTRRQSTETKLPDEATVPVEETIEGMDVDAPISRPEEVTTEPTESSAVEIIETGIAINEEAHMTTTEISQETLKDAQKEPPTQPQDTLGGDARPSIVHEAAVLSGESADITLESKINVGTHESQGSETFESHDITMQDVSSEVTTQPGSRVVNILDQADNGKAKKTDEEVEPEKDGQISPPPTQAPEKQATQEDNINLLNDGPIEHLPTPGDTQQMVEVEMADTPIVAHDNQNSDEEEGPEDQIMTELLQHSPVRQEIHLPTDPVMSSPVPSRAKSPHPTDLVNESPMSSPNNVEPASEIVVAKSLRPRRHKSTKTLGGSDQDDPSIALITATPASKTAESGSKHSSPARSARSGRSGSKTRSKTNRDDPSIQLAGGSAQADAKNKRRRKATDDESIVSADNNSPGSQRVLRPRTDHNDPSILLAKGSSPSTRQTRSQKTPDLKRETPRRETRSVSRSFQLQEDSPNVSFASLKSPSIVGSTATVAEEQDIKALKLQLVNGLRTKLQDFLPVKQLNRNSLGKTVDVLAVVTQTPPHPQRPKKSGGPRDFMLTLCLTDPSAAPTQVRVAQIFRPYKTALPEVESGDIILLRRMKVLPMSGRGFGLRSEDSSAWAVSKFNNQEVLSQVKGPPVETTPEEIEYAKGLRHWWSLQDDNAMGKIASASRKVAEAGKENAK